MKSPDHRTDALEKREHQPPAFMFAMRLRILRESEQRNRQDKNCNAIISTAIQRVAADQA